MWWKTAWLLTKKYWQIAALLVGTLVAYFIFKRRESSFVDDLEKIQKIHAEELARIQELRAKEQLEHEKNEEALKKTLDEIQRQHEAYKKSLDKKKKREVENIVRKYGNDPAKLAEEVSRSVGFKVYIPKEL